MRTLIIRLFAAEDGHLSRLHGLMQRPGGRPVRFLGADQLVQLVRELGNAGGGEAETPGPSVAAEPETVDGSRPRDGGGGDRGSP